MPSDRFRRLHDVLETGEDFCLQVLTHLAWWQDNSMLPWDRICRCVEGRKIYNDLKNEFIVKFWNKDISFEQSASENDPHSSIY